MTMALINITYDNNISFNEKGEVEIPFEHPALWGIWLKCVLTPVIVLAGIIGNTLSFVLMTSKALRHKSYSNYLSALAICDTFTLIIRQVRTVDDYYWNASDVHEVFNRFNNFGCKIFNFMEHVAYLMSSWLIVLMATERLIAVCFPFKRVAIRRRAGASITICVLLLVVCLTQSFRLLMVIHKVDNEEFNCEASNEYLEIYTSLDVYFYQWTLTFGLPVTIVLGCNSSVLYQIFKVKREIRGVKRTRSHRAVQKGHRTTCMLLTVTSTYIVTLLPLFILTLVIDLSVRIHGYKALHIYNALGPYVHICIAISLVNYAANFYIYILSGRRFRFELKQLFVRQRRLMKISLTARSTKEEVIRFREVDRV